MHKKWSASSMCSPLNKYTFEYFNDRPVTIVIICAGNYRKRHPKSHASKRLFVHIQFDFNNLDK